MAVILPENCIMAKTDSLATFYQDIKRLKDAGYKFGVTMIDNIKVNDVSIPGVLGILVFDVLPKTTVFSDKLVEIRYDTKNMKWVPAKTIDLGEEVLASNFAYFKEFLENYNASITF